MRLRPAVFLAAIALGAALTPLLRPARGAPIAVLLDLQGGQAGLGRPAMNGFVLGLQEDDAEGPVPYAALLDTRSDLERTRALAEGAAREVVVAAGFTDNDSVLVAGPLFDHERVPFLAIGATDPRLPEDAGARVFLTAFGDNTQAAAGAEFARARFGGTAAVLWDSTSQYTRTLPVYFRQRFAELGGQVLLDASYDGGCDLADLGARVQALAPAPDLVYLAGLPDCIGAVVASLRTAGVAQPILGGDGLDTADLLVGPAGPTSGVWFTTHAWLSPVSGTPLARQFSAAYRAAYGAEPEDAFAALGYDAARLLRATLRDAKSPKPRDLLEQLERTRDFEGVTGTISFAPGSHVPLKTVWILEVQGGQRSLADAFVPSSVPPPLPADR